LRRIVLTLIALIALACLAPKAIGLLVIGHQDQLAAGVAHRLRGAELITEETISGWLTTSTRHRLRVTDPSSALLIADLTGRPSADSDPALVVESRIAHGPWPLFEGRPGLARMRSRLSIDIGGQLIPIPGGAITDIAFDGSGSSSMEFGRVDTTVQGGASVLIWEGARLDVAFDPDLEHIESSARVGSLTVLGPQGELRLGEAGIEGRSSATPYGFWTGSSRLTISDVSITGVDGDVNEAGDLVLDITVTIDGEVAGHRIDMTIDGLRSDQVDGGAIRLSAETGGLSAPALGRLNQAESANAMDWLAVMVPGADVRIHEFTFRTDRGDMAFTGRCQVPEDAAVSDGSADLLSSLTGEARLTISAGMLDRGQGSQVEPLLATGYLKRTEDGSLVADVRIGSGLMTVNGLPMPLIIPR
jgi:hypothetical protein